MAEMCESVGEVSVLKEKALLQHILDARAWAKKEQARLFRGRTSQPATARVIHGGRRLHRLEGSERRPAHSSGQR